MNSQSQSTFSASDLQLALPHVSFRRPPENVASWYKFPAFPVAVTTDPYRRESVLTPIETAVVGDITGIASGYHIRLDEDRELTRHFEAVYHVAPEGHDEAHYRDLPDLAKSKVSDLILECIFFNQHIIGDVSDWRIALDPYNFEILEFHFAQARILVDSRFIKSPERFYLDVDDALDDGNLLRPVLVELFGQPSRLEAEALVYKHMAYMSALLPAHLVFPMSQWWFSEWAPR